MFVLAAAYGGTTVAQVNARDYGVPPGMVTLEAVRASGASSIEVKAGRSIGSPSLTGKLPDLSGDLGIPLPTDWQGDLYLVVDAAATDTYLLFSAGECS